MCVLPLTGDLTASVPVCCSLLPPWGPPVLSPLVLSCVHAQPHASGTPSPGAAPRRSLGAHFPLDPTVARLSLHPTSSRAMGPPRLHTSHSSPFPPELGRLQWERTPRGGISTLPPPAASPEGPRLGQVAGGRVSSGNLHSLFVGCRALPGFTASRLLWFSRPLSDPPFFFSPSYAVFSAFERDYSNSIRGGEHFVVQFLSPDAETLATIRGGRNG